MTSALQQKPRGVAAYAKANQTVRSAREIERDTIGLVTQRLRTAKEKDDAMARARAVSDNLTLWYVLIGDLSEDTNQLPIELRAKIISVGMAVVRECQKVGRKEAVDLDFLITINEAMIEGLAS